MKSADLEELTLRMDKAGKAAQDGLIPFSSLRFLVWLGRRCVSPPGGHLLHFPTIHRISQGSYPSPSSPTMKIGDT